MKRVDRRVRRTREHLKEALVALIEERGFESLSVQDIIDRANVGRATFYAHFDNKEDLLVSGFEDLRGALREHQRRLREQAAETEAGSFLFSRALFDHVAVHRNVFRAMTGERSALVVQRLIQKILLELVREDLRALRSSRGRRPTSVEAEARYIAGGLGGLLTWWVDGGRALTVEELDATFLRLAAATLQAASR